MYCDNALARRFEERREANPNAYCRGCGVPDDCYCHEDCHEAPCAYCAWEDTVNREEAHAEALNDIAHAPALRPGEIPGDAMGLAGRYPQRAPWWWDRPESWEYRAHHGLIPGLGEWAEQRAAGAI
jgi:hypothetical protein